MKSRYAGIFNVYKIDRWISQSELTCASELAGKFKTKIAKTSSQRLQMDFSLKFLIKTGTLWKMIKGKCLAILSDKKKGVFREY